MTSSFTPRSNEESEKSLDKVPEKEKVGIFLRKTRIAARIDVQKICSEVRITTSQLEAIESGHYDKLPGEPYVRAFLNTLARYLHLDPKDIVQRYNQEIGILDKIQPQSEPTKDDNLGNKIFHKQIFILTVIVLFIALFLIILRLNKSGNKEIAANLDSTSNEVLVPYSGPESLQLRSLQPSIIDSTLAKPGDSIAQVKTQKAADTVKKADTTHHPLEKANKSVEKLDSANNNDKMGKTVLTVRCIVDSALIHVARPGRQ